MWIRLSLTGGLTLAAMLFGQACDKPALLSPDAVASSGLRSQADTIPLPAPEDFVSVIDNPFLPFTRGRVYEYRAEVEEGVEVTRVTVTRARKVILGITATVVHDEVSLNGALIEDTFDWFAQDKAGNVWYLGEDSCEIENGQCVSKEGSWEAGIDGAEAGIVMWANPAEHKGKAYRQEFYEGVAEDMAKVMSLDASASVPYGDFSGCVETMDWNPLDRGGREHKIYCAGVGLVLETAGGGSRNELVSLTGA